MTETILTLSGYRMTEKIYDSSRTLVYRAQREIDNQAVVIKFLKNEYPSLHELVQFRNQYTLAKNLDIEGIVHPYALENYKNGFALIMEDVGAVSLHKYITTNPLPLQLFFNVAIAIAKILEGFYENRIIHKDIKPQNILINPETKRVKLIDFSIASLLPRETQDIKNPNVLEGTLAYLSPEQTGRMNRGIDYRTDFYSLGVTFYELLTGQRPFQSNDPMELVHCHIAKMPTLPIQVNAAIPQSVNDIIMKLMMKPAEERYQTAFGLRKDLENCQQQWTNNGSIMPFTLGQRDISARFNIPEKLYGRKTEVATLLAAFDRVSEGNTEMMLITGFSGVGKTALVSEIHKPIVRQRAYFVKGKFDQFKRDIPFSAFVQALQMFMQQLSAESNKQVQAWQTKILQALGNDGQVIIEVIPELKHIIGKQPPVRELEGHAAQNRFDFLFHKFINVFTTAKHPLVIFLDDLQWIDSASLKLLLLLMSKTDNHHLLLVGAYRDNEVNAAHPLMLTLEEIRKTTALVNQITLAPLKLAELNHLIADTLSCPSENAKPLASLVIQKTQGNPYFTNQFLRFLHEKSLISFDFKCGYWQCDIAQVALLSVSDDVVGFMADQLQELPTNTLNVLKLAACIGNPFDLATLAIVQDKSHKETAADLWKAVQESFILPINDTYKFFYTSESADITEISKLSIHYKFLHDRVQQAAYSLIPEEQKSSNHLQIGQLQKSYTRAEELDDNIFDIVNQLNLGANLITTPSEREELAQLNLQAGHKAKASTAYAAAGKYLMVGIELLSASSWQNQYDLTLALYESATEVAYLNGDFELQAQLAAIILAQANTILDKVKTYLIQGQVYMAQHQQKAALELMLPVLKQLGITFPQQPSATDAELFLQETQLAWKEKPIESLCHLPVMADNNQKAAMQILSFLIAPTSEAVPEFFPLIVCKQIQLSINYGNVPESAVSYACYGFIQVGMDNIETGYKFGQLALSILEKFNAKEHKAKVCDAVESFIAHWKVPFRNTLKPLQEGYQSGLEVGDFEFTGYCGLQYCAQSYYCGKELTELEREMANYSKAFRQIKQEISLNGTEIHRQGVLNLMGQAENPCRLIGKAYNEEQMLPLHKQQNDVFALYMFYFQKTVLSYLFQEYRQTIENVVLIEPSLVVYSSSGGTPIIYLCDSLARLAVYPSGSNEEQQSHLDKVQANQEKMQNWAKHAPMNFQHKFDLVEAERHHVLGKHVEAMDFYDRAIAGAKENGFIQEEAIANELAAKFYLTWGKEKVAQAYLTDAYYGYARWGAKAKVDDLKQHYPQLLTLVLNQENELAITTSSGTSALTSVMGSELLNLTTVLKSSQTLSEEIHLDKLLTKLMQMVLENAGAETGFLLLPKQEQWVIEAQNQIGSTEITVLQSIPFEKSQEICVAIVNYVARTKEPLVLKNASQEGKFTNDPKIIKRRAKSLLCAPLLNQGKLTGIIYLENELVEGAFTKDRLTVLNLLSAQSAISIENASLYNNLEKKVIERTHTIEAQKNELAATLQRLQSTQQQLIEAEKIAALGNLVVGVAHEINTPVGVSVTGASQLELLTQELRQLFEGKKMKRSDLQKYLNSATQVSDMVLKNLKRVAELVQNFKQIAVDRTSEQPRTFGVKKHLDHIVSSLQSNMKAANQHNIEIMCDTDITVSTYAVGFSQIVTNLLENSIIHGFQNKPDGKITIEVTTSQDNQLILRHFDNGSGMSGEVRQQIFEPFFAVNRQTGMGLGLNIVFNLVKHLQGTIDCESIEGSGTSFTISIPMSV